jgi:CRP/FNR family transcriptional regulator, anaerobic regulatory protein
MIMTTSIPIHPERSWRGTADCQACTIRKAVLFADLSEDDFALFHAPIDDLAFRSQAVVFRQEEKALGIFTIRKGMIKLVRNMPNGSTRIVRVLRDGDVVGLEALVGGAYDYDAVALEDSEVCRIPLELIHNLSQNGKNLHKGLMQKWHQAVSTADGWLADLNTGTARQRVAHLALKMRSPNDLDNTLLFSRQDMGAILNLQPETVSRELRSLVRQGILRQTDAKARQFFIQLPNALERAALDC